MSGRATGSWARCLAQRRAENRSTANDFLVFNQQFNTLIKAGIPILKALDLLAERAAARAASARARRSPPPGSRRHDRYPRRWNSRAFSQRSTRFPFWREKRAAILSGVLEYYIAYQRVTTGLKKKLISTLIYPIILVCAATCIVTYLVSSVIPKFAGLYNDLNIKLPEATRILLAVTVTYRPYLLAAIALVVFVAVAAFAWSRSDAGRLGPGADPDAPAAGRRDDHEISVRAILPHAFDAAGRRHARSCRPWKLPAARFSSRLVSGAITQGAQLVREGQSLHSSLAPRACARSGAGNDRSRRSQRSACRPCSPAWPNFMKTM